MAIVHRRVFYAKVGMAGPLVEHMRAGDQILSKSGGPFSSRILTDDLTGRSDRVVVEWEMASAAEMTAALDEAMSDPTIQGEMGQWMEKLAALIEYAEGENWAVR